MKKGGKAENLIIKDFSVVSLFKWENGFERNCFNADEQLHLPENMKCI